MYIYTYTSQYKNKCMLPRIIYPVNVLVSYSEETSLGSDCIEFICSMFVGLIQLNLYKAASLRDETTGHSIEVAV